MTEEEFWLAFLGREYAVRCDTQEQHDQFAEALGNRVETSNRHMYSPSYPYLYWLAVSNRLSDWTGKGSFPYAKQKITFQDWLAIQNEPEEDIAVGNLSEVL